MKINRLKVVEREFLKRYPGGFSHPDLVELGKKHQITKRVEQVQELFAEDRFNLLQVTVENMLKTINRSSLVSRFEKPRLRDWLKVMSRTERESYALALRDLLHGDQEYGFNMMVSLLQPGMIAKWPVITVIPYYYAPMDEVFVKPTTTKKIIRYFELEGLEYRPRPSYDFYRQYREAILALKSAADKSLQYDNAAFSGFLMMMI